MKLHTTEAVCLQHAAFWFVIFGLLYHQIVFSTFAISATFFNNAHLLPSVQAADNLFLRTVIAAVKSQYNKRMSERLLDTPPRISSLTDLDCDAELTDQHGRLRLNLQQKRLLVALARTIIYGYGKITVTVHDHKSRLSVQYDDLLVAE